MSSPDRIQLRIAHIYWTTLVHMQKSNQELWLSGCLHAPPGILRTSLSLSTRREQMHLNAFTFEILSLSLSHLCYVEVVNADLKKFTGIFI